MTRKRRRFTKEFKVEAVRLASEGDRPPAEVARELGIRGDLLRAWKRRVEEKTPEELFPGHGRAVGRDEELRALRREVEVLRQEREILKKAHRYISGRSSL